MSLLNNIRRSLKSTTVATFSADRGPGEDYVGNGYYGIYNAAYGGYSSALGSVVNDARAMSLTAVYACVKIISEDVGSLPAFINKRQGDGAVIAKSHPAYKLLHDAPNPDMTAVQFRETMTSHALLCGNAYAYKERSRGENDRIVALWPLMPYEIRRDRDSRGRPVFINTGQQKTYTNKDLLQIHGFGTTGVDGLNILQYAKNTIGLGLAQEDYASRFFSQDQTPNIVLRHPGALGPEGVQGVKAAWEQNHKGQKNWHAPAVLQEGMDISQLTPNHRESQLTEQRAFQLLEICRLFRVPPHKLGEMGRATYNNISAQNVNYYNETLRQWLVRWEQAVNHWVLDDSDEYYFEHEISGLLRGDFAMQTDGFRTLLASGVYSVNEVRALLNYNPIEGGDEHFIQLNQGTLQKVAQGVADAPPEDEPVPDDGENVVPISRTVRVGSQ